MPVQPTWFSRIPDLLAMLQAEAAPTAFTRRDLERWLGVRRRRAILLLHRMDAKRQGSELRAPRESVIRYFEECWSDEAAARAEAQERQVAQTLAEARRALSLPRISLPPPARLSTITFAGLPAGIHLTRAELSVSFSSAQDLIEKLFTVAQALANDYESLEEALTEVDPKHGTAHGLPF